MARIIMQVNAAFLRVNLLFIFVCKLLEIFDMRRKTSDLESSFTRITMRICLTRNRPALIYIWWAVYFVLSDSKDFEHNYIHAWSQHCTHSTHLFVENDHLRMPLSDGDDAQTLKHLRMYYLLIRARKGLSAMIPLKEVERIDRVKVVDGKLGMRIETIDLGGSAGRFLEAPQRLSGQHDLTEKLKASPESEGVEFVRFWDNISISIVALSLCLASLVFAIVWVAVFVRRGSDLQATVQTAFTVASFMVTSSALVIALIAYLEQTRRGVS